MPKNVEAAEVVYTHVLIYVPNGVGLISSFEPSCGQDALVVHDADFIY